VICEQLLTLDGESGKFACGKVSLQVRHCILGIFRGAWLLPGKNTKSQVTRGTIGRVLHPRLVRVYYDLLKASQEVQHNEGLEFGMVPTGGTDKRPHMCNNSLLHNR
jgi:hypothetical protein